MADQLNPALPIAFIYCNAVSVNVYGATYATSRWPGRAR